MALSSRNKVSVQFSMSGMTDIVFLLLIFFMLTSTLIAPNAINLLLPKSNNQTKASPLATVSISPELHYYYGTRRISFSQLEPLLVKDLQYRKDPTFALHADKSVPIEYVVKVMNVARKHRFRVILATAPEN